MTLQEAIDHALNKASGDNECAEQHLQLAKWLKELQYYRLLDPRRQNL